MVLLSEEIRSLRLKDDDTQLGRRGGADYLVVCAPEGFENVIQEGSWLKHKCMPRRVSRLLNVPVLIGFNDNCDYVMWFV